MKLELDLNQLLGMEYDEDGEPVGRRQLRDEVVAIAAATLVKEVRDDAKRSVRENVESTVRDEIGAIVRKALSKPIQQMSSWGERKGEPTTVLELVRTQLEAFLSNTTESRDRYGNEKPANLRQLVEQATREVISKDMREAVNEAKAGVTNEVTQRALKAAVETLTQGLKP
ncbi:hypothetical protein [Amycolatopsis sp. NPDC051372]|uniref:hypothetical protein n=1 Tax=Amycolatopsis sp. NPDC051372 TaxID=3155669 RepID=UPI00342EB018